MRLIERLTHMLVVLLGVSMLMFFLVRVLPGDPVAAALGEGVDQAQVEKLRAQMRLDKPIPLQYLSYLGDLARGHFGPSLIESRDVGQIIRERLPATLELVLAGLFIAVVVGLPLGVISAIRRNTRIDHAARVISLSGVSFPEFWVALMLQLVFGAWLAMLPVTGRLSGPAPADITGLYLLDSLLTANGAAFWDSARHLLAPAFVLALGPMTNIARMVRSSMLDELAKPYPALSRAVGIHPFIVNMKYVLRNAFSSTLTVIGFLFPLMIGGAFVVENVFAWPGIARFGAAAIVANDYNAVVGITLVVCLFVVVINFIVEELYTVLDPRIRLGAES
ncbi:ABC transporter permease [Verticiella sediminum]|uniref:ABC transporter permease n=1 Tax=Verticiella sediminum TaxID=1247510 RepID=A0A556AGZ1_9BURK|nr:ABC transporter permease [Verticiella sediminum]TSH92139.1 ABC transporter permease [Verticiella sediminum]